MPDVIKTKKVTELETKDTPEGTDLLITGHQGTNVLKRFTVDALLNTIKTKITGWTFNTLTTMDKTLPGAVNELNSNTYNSKH